MTRPTQPTPQPQPQPRPTTPWTDPPQIPPRGPRVWPAAAITWPVGPDTNLTRLAELVADTDDLIAGCRATVAETTVAVARSRAVRLGVDGGPTVLPSHLPGLHPLTDVALREVA